MDAHDAQMHREQLEGVRIYEREFMSCTAVFADRRH